MPTKPGGGGLPQPYDPDNGQYTDMDKYWMRLKDRRALEYLKYTFKIPEGMEVHFPTKGIHDNSYGRMFVELYRDKFKYVPAKQPKVGYLLTHKTSGDKSSRLSEWGYTKDSFDKLYNDIMNKTKFNTIKFSRYNDIGRVMLKAETILNDHRATSIWVLNHKDYTFEFVTLYTTGKVYDNDKK